MLRKEQKDGSPLQQLTNQPLPFRIYLIYIKKLKLLTRTIWPVEMSILELTGSSLLEADKTIVSVLQKGPSSYDQCFFIWINPSQPLPLLDMFQKPSSQKAIQSFLYDITCCQTQWMSCPCFHMFGFHMFGLHTWSVNSCVTEYNMYDGGEGSKVPTVFHPPNCRCIYIPI